MKKSTYIVSVDTMVSVNATSDDEALILAKAKFKDQFDELELIIEEITDEL